MSSIVKSTDRRSGITYVYTSESYWDREKKSPRSRRKLIGKIDPETGDMIPTNGTQRKAKERKAKEAEELKAKILDASSDEFNKITENYVNVLNQFEQQLRSIDEGTKDLLKEIEKTKQSIQNQNKNQ